MPAFIAFANRFQFRPGQVIRQGPVMSTFLLWGCSGSGYVVVNGSQYALEVMDFLVIPWGFHIEYHADPIRPFLVAGIHLIPDQPEGTPTEFLVSHDRSMAFPGSNDRRDDPSLGLSSLIRGNFSDWPVLRSLSDYVIEWFCRGQKETATSFFQALILLDELVRLGKHESSQGSEGMHPALSRVQSVVRRNLQQVFTLTDLAASAGVSQATLERLFRRHLRISPMRWIESERLEQAARLLSSTADPIAEIGAQVGLSDPQHFSRRFRYFHGITPSQWRRRHAMIV